MHAQACFDGRCPKGPKRLSPLQQRGWRKGAMIGGAAKGMIAGCLGIGGTLLLPAASLAQTFDVKQLDVTGGALEAASDNSVQGGIRRRDDNRSAHDLSLDYGVIDFWRLSGVLKLENPLEQDFRLARSSIENIWVFRQVPKAGGLGLGWFTTVEVATDAAATNASQFGPIITLKDDKVTFTANPFFEKTFGRNRVEGIALNYGWNVKYALNDKLAVGMEGFGLVENLGNSSSLDEQQHRLGPALFATIKLGEHLTITPDVGLFFGLTEATPNLTLKLNVGVPLIEPSRSADK
jgi:hypothetical protein